MLRSPPSTPWSVSSAAWLTVKFRNSTHWIGESIRHEQINIQIRYKIYRNANFPLLFLIYSCSHGPLIYINSFSIHIKSMAWLVSEWVWCLSWHTEDLCLVWKLNFTSSFYILCQRRYVCGEEERDTKRIWTTANSDLLAVAGFIVSWRIAQQLRRRRRETWKSC